MITIVLLDFKYQINSATIQVAKFVTKILLTCIDKIEKKINTNNISWIPFNQDGSRI